MKRTDDLNWHPAIEAIRLHIRTLNHSSERMSSDLTDLTERVSSIEAHVSWITRLVWIILGGIISILVQLW
jgi:hypothetical protein